MTKSFQGTVRCRPDARPRGESFESGRMAQELNKALRILRLKQMIDRTSLSRATLYALMASDPTFPKKIKLTARSIGFLESEVDAWIESRAQARGIAA